jgi:hypothetical protein
VPLGRVRCIPKSETFTSFIGFTSLVVWSAVCSPVAACLGALIALLGHWSDLDGFVFASDFLAACRMDSKTKIKVFISTKTSNLNFKNVSHEGLKTDAHAVRIPRQARNE